MGDVAANGADARAIEFKTGGVTQFIKAQRAVDDEFVFIDLAEFLLFRIELVLNVADQFLKHIFEGDHANRTAELVDNDGNMGVFSEKEIEEFLKRHHLRTWNQLAFDEHKIRRR